MPGFSLLDRPWLPCLTRDGRPVEVGLRDLFLHSHEYRELFDPSPPVTIALHRLLLALVRRICPLSSAAEWHAAWMTGRFDAAAVEAYFARWSDRFDLFDPRRPFMQSRPAEGVRRHPIARLIPEAASGNNPTLFDHSVDARPRAVPASFAARRLIAAQATALGGGVSEPFNFCDAPLARDCAALVCGETLFETLLLNSPPRPSAAEDAPLWEHDGELNPRRDGTAVPGEMALFTWPARRIALLADDEGRVTGCQVRQGLVPPPGYRDPHKAYCLDRRGVPVALRLTPTRTAWRDLPVWLGLLPGARCPEGVAWLRRLSARENGGQLGGRSVQLAVFGPATAPGRAAVLFWRHERYPLDFFLQDSEVFHEFVSGLERAESGERTIAAAASFYAKLTGLPPALCEAAVGRAEANYWARLDRGFRAFASGLAADSAGAATAWSREVASAAAESFALAEACCCRRAGHPRASALAGRFFIKRLAAAVRSSPGRMFARR